MKIFSAEGFLIEERTFQYYVVFFLKRPLFYLPNISDIFRLNTLIYPLNSIPIEIDVLKVL